MVMLAVGFVVPIKTTEPQAATVPVALSVWIVSAPTPAPANDLVEPLAMRDGLAAVRAAHPDRRLDALMIERLRQRPHHGRQIVAQWLDEIVRGMPGEEKDTPKFRDRCRKARDAAALRLRSRGVIGMDGDYVWRTNRRIASVDPAVGGETLPQNSEDEAKSSDLLAEVSGSFG
jgi:hypothetical protein